MTSILIKFAAALAVIAALFAAERYVENLGYTRAKSEDQAAANKLKADAADTLAQQIALTRKAEKALQDFTNAQNLKDADHAKIVADLSDRLHALADASGRLRDPHATAGCGLGGGGSQGSIASPADGGATDTTDAGGLLSADLSGLLQQLSASADRINIAYASCRAQAIEDRAGN